MSGVEYSAGIQIGHSAEYSNCLFNRRDIQTVYSVNIDEKTKILNTVFHEKVEHMRSNFLYNEYFFID